MRIEFAPDAGTFLDRAGALLERHEVENALLFGISHGLVADPTIAGEPARFALGLEPATRVVRAAALQTPPRNIVLGFTGDPAIDAAFASALATSLGTASFGTSIPGVTGPSAIAARFATAWTRRTGRPAERRIAERLHQLTEVRPPRPAPGAMRVARAADEALIASWLEAFHLEALREPLPDAAIVAARWVHGAGRKLYAWEVAGSPVAICGASGTTPHGIRIGPVYTPPIHRNRGFAGNLVAAVSQVQLEAGRSFVCLFTDLANPTANHVYTALGFEPVIDVDDWRFA